MKKRLSLSVVIILLFFLAGTAQAFVPESSHLLYLVIKKIKKPVGLEVLQTRKILNNSNEAEPEEIYFESKEMLSYSYPNKLRIQIISDWQESFSLESDFKYLKVNKEEIISYDKSLVDLYSDILLYRDHETLINQLEISGVDTTKVTFQRYNDTICYVIGMPSAEIGDFSGLWIEKDTFLPVKYTVKKNGKKVEIFYKNWQKVSKTLYPMQIHIFLNNNLFAILDVKSANLKSDFLPVLFDLDGIKNLYPENIIYQEEIFVDEDEKYKQSIMDGELKPAPEMKQINE